MLSPVIDLLFQKIRSKSAVQLIKLSVKKLEIIVVSYRGRRRDALAMAYNSNDWFDCKLNCRLHLADSVVPSNSDSGYLEVLCSKYVDHQFDLLGSGWVKIEYGMKCAGLEGFVNKPCGVSGIEEELVDNVNFREIQRIRSFLDTSYIPIDWHIDFKTGFRWNPGTWYLDIRYGDKNGVDIKVPWELARMQHLPQLARAFVTGEASASNTSLTNVYVFEYRNQVLDFISANPPRFGVNWSCAMDVAIRIANMLLAFDIFQSAGVVFDAEFEAIFTRSVFEHGQHIATNLEWSKEFRGNHYLANLVGLIFAASYLPECDDTNIWLQFSVKEFLIEIQYQFNDEGSNFESSTAYHGLSSQLVAFATAMIIGLPSERVGVLVEDQYHGLRKSRSTRESKLRLYGLPGNEGSLCLIPPEYWGKIYSMATFIRAITGPDGYIVQVGDNDSGRLFKLAPRITVLKNRDALKEYSNLEGLSNLQNDEPYYLEDQLNHNDISQEILSIVRLEESVSTELSRKDCIGVSGIIFGLAGRKSAVLKRTEQESLNISQTNIRPAIPASANIQNYSRPDLDLLMGMELRCYPEFGLYIWRSENVFMTVRCGALSQRGFGGHAHNDQLSLELWIGGKSLISDPGTYLYTPSPKKRNLYRSVKAHNAPQFDDLSEPGRLDVSVFSLSNQGEAKVLQLSEKSFLGTHAGFNIPVYRAIEISLHSVVISDWCSTNSANLTLVIPPPLPYSRGYGWLGNRS